MNHHTFAYFKYRHLLTILVGLTLLMLEGEARMDMSSARELNTSSVSSVSSSGTQTCTVNEDCDSYPYQVCGAGNICVHKKLFPMYGMEIAGIIILALVMALCTVAGIGGGGVVIPLCMVFFSFQTKNAIAISGFSILTCSVTRYFFNIR
jgi:hypothetical protein